MFKRHVYVSRAVDGLSITDVRELMRRAELRNQHDDLTGALLFHEGYFVQALEGAADRVDVCMAQIQSDNRHVEIEQRDSLNTNIRMFPSLWMPMTLGTDVDSALLASFSYKKGFPRDVFPTGKLERLLVTLSLNQWPPPIHKGFKLKAA
jgi:Sensors of blue-light using FAD